MPPDKLISRIKAVLNGDTGHFEIQSLALEYSELVMRTRERIDQCVTLIRAGNDYAALQVAESAPPILDTAATLAFAESPEWLALCRANGVPWPPPLDSRSIELVNNLYNRQISESHPLYRDYRQAIRERDDLRALGILSTIIRINPEDRNARREFVRLGEKARETHLKKLATLLDADDTFAAFTLADALENLSLPALADAPELARVREMRADIDRAQALGDIHKHLAEAAPLHETGDWRGTIPLIGRCRSLERHYTVALPPETADALGALEYWALACQNALKRRRERADTVTRANETLRKVIAAANFPGKNAALILTHIQALTDAADAADTLANTPADEPQDGDPNAPGMPTDAPAMPDAPLTAAARARAIALVKRIRQQKIFRAAAALVALLLLAAGAFAAHNFWANERERDTALARIKVLPSENRLLAAEAFEKNLKDEWNADPTFATAHTALTNWATKQRAAVNKLSADADFLAARPDTISPAELKKALAALEALRKTNALPADTRAAADAKVAAADARLRNLREKISAAQTPPFDARLTAAETEFARISALPTVATRLARLDSFRTAALAPLTSDADSLSFLLAPVLLQRTKALADATTTARPIWYLSHRCDNDLAPVGTLAAYYVVLRSLSGTNPPASATSENRNEDRSTPPSNAPENRSTPPSNQPDNNDSIPDTPLDDLPADATSSVSPHRPNASPAGTNADTNTVFAAFDADSEAAANTTPPATAPKPPAARAAAAAPPPADAGAGVNFKLLLAGEADMHKPAEKVLAPAVFKLWKVAVATLDVRVTPFLPKTFLPAETKAAERVLSHALFEKVFRNTLRTHPRRSSAPDTTLYTYNAPQTTRSELRQQQVAAVILDDGRTRSENFYFDSQTGGKELVQITDAPESLFFRGEFAKFYDAYSHRFNEPLLSTLDRVRFARISPFFKAWLQTQLTDIALARPDEWGLAFSPTALRAIENLRLTAGSRINAYSWLNPDRLADQRVPLNTYYEQAQKIIPLHTEALAWLQVFKRLASPGFIYTGYINSERQLRLAPGAKPAGILVGIGPDGSPVVCLLKDLPAAVRYTDGSVRIAGASLPFVTHSPVLALHMTPAAAAAATAFPANAAAPVEGWDNFVFQPANTAAP